MNDKKIGLGSVIATGVGLVVASSCLLTLGIGAGNIGTPFIITMVIACLVNIFTLLSIAELNALMPNLTGGLAQFSLACVGPFVTIICMVGGYMLCNSLAGSVEGAVFGNTFAEIFSNLGIPAWVFTVILIVLLAITNLNGVDVFIKVQDFVAYALIISIVAMGVMGALGIGTGEIVEQPAALATDFKSITGLCGVAFFLFVGGEYVIPLTKNCKNAKRDIPLGMVLSMLIILAMQTFLTLGFKNYTVWGDLASSTTPQILYGQVLLGPFGKYWMLVITLLAAVSSVNTVMGSLAYILMGMSKINLLPQMFSKVNKKGAPYIGILLETAIFITLNVTGLSSTSSISYMISVLAVLWLISYIISNLNVIILRRRLANAPRNFKTPLGYTVPILGMLGSAYMIYNIDPSWEVKLSLYKVVLVTLLVLGTYSFIWVKTKVKRPLFKPYAIKEVMAMENELYQEYHSKENMEKFQNKLLRRTNA
ncbi:MAG: APC family permease [Lachnospiraceae bacterium]|nr:APC family permease [Lachnospiraceae bacterium]